MTNTLAQASEQFLVLSQRTLAGDIVTRDALKDSLSEVSILFSAASAAEQKAAAPSVNKILKNAKKLGLDKPTLCAKPQ